jgi:hypothetical protein
LLYEGKVGLPKTQEVQTLRELAYKAIRFEKVKNFKKSCGNSNLAIKTCLVSTQEFQNTITKEVQVVLNQVSFKN